MSLLLLVACSTTPAPAPAPKPVLSAATARPAPTTIATSGQHAPPLSLLPVDGGTPWALEDLLDPTGNSCPDAFLVAFMASWCTYCSQSLPTLVELQEQFPELGIVTVTIDTTPDAQEAEAEKVKKAGLTGPVLVADAATRTAWLGAGGSVPHYYFVDHDGKIRSQDKGFGDKVKPMMPKQAAAVLGQSAAAEVEE
jgi:thiol-disulfide isomerase/thioredoxin